MTNQEIKDALNELYSEMLVLRGHLRDTDYVAAKIAEGKATKTEYKDMIDQRQGWRDRINAIQTEINSLETQVVEIVDEIKVED